MGIVKEKIILKNGIEVECIYLKNTKGIMVEILTLGGIIKSIQVPDKEGKLENILIGFKDVNDYIENPGSMNGIIGRTAGRIHKGQVTLNDIKYQLPVNPSGNTLHGGKQGFHKQIWQAKDVSHAKEQAVELSYISKDNEENYPGELKVKLTYSLSEDNTFKIRYEAISDKDTLVNLTNHAYFNLSGNGKRDVLDQLLCIHADEICELDEQSIPTGTLLKVKEHSAFDFNKAKPIGRDILEEDIQLSYTGGYDHPWLLRGDEVAVELSDPISGRKLSVRTNQKAVVVYTMNNTCPKELINGKKDIKRYGICFETQSLPIGYEECFKEDALLKAGDIYHHETTFSF